MIIGLTCLAACHNPKAGVKLPVPDAAPNSSQALKTPEKLPASTPVARAVPKLKARQPADKIQIEITHKLQADLDSDGTMETAVSGYYDYGYENLRFFKIVKINKLTKKTKILFTLNLYRSDPVVGLQVWNHPQAGKLLVIKHEGGTAPCRYLTILSYKSGAGKFVKIPVLGHDGEPMTLNSGVFAIRGAALWCSGDDTSYYDKFSCTAAYRPPRVEYIFRYNPRRTAFLIVKTTYELPLKKAPAAYLKALSLIKQADEMGGDPESKPKARTLYLQAIAKLERLQQTQAKPAFKQAIAYSRRQIEALSH